MAKAKVGERCEIANLHPNSTQTVFAYLGSYSLPAGTARRPVDLALASLPTRPHGANSQRLGACSHTTTTTTTTPLGHTADPIGHPTHPEVLTEDHDGKRLDEACIAGADGGDEVGRFDEVVGPDSEGGVEEWCGVFVYLSTDAEELAGDLDVRRLSWVKGDGRYALGDLQTRHLR